MLRCGCGDCDCFSCCDNDGLVPLAAPTSISSSSFGEGRSVESWGGYKERRLTLRSVLASKGADEDVRSGGWANGGQDNGIDGGGWTISDGDEDEDEERKRGRGYVCEGGSEGRWDDRCRLPEEDPRLRDRCDRLEMPSGRGEGGGSRIPIASASRSSSAILWPKASLAALIWEFALHIDALDSGRGGRLPNEAEDTTRRET